MNIPIVVQMLKELSGWLEDSKPNQEVIHKIINELECSDLSEHRLQQLKFQLSSKMLFHPKWLGDVYIPDFVGDRSTFAWSKYLAQIEDICQENL